MRNRIPAFDPPRSPALGLAEALFASLAALSTLRPVYPAYLASRIKRALTEADPEGVIAGVGDIESLGNSRYAVPVTDADGTSYRVTVEVANG